MDLNDFHMHRGMGFEPQRRLNTIEFSTDIEVCCNCGMEFPESQMRWIEGEGLTCNICIETNYKPIRLSSPIEI